MSEGMSFTQEIIATIGVLEKYGLSDGSHRSREYQDRKKV
jgi:hypothetical protein